MKEVKKVLEGEPLNASDKLSFDHPPVNSQEDWEYFQATIWKNAEEFAVLIESLPEEKLGQIFVEEKNGIYYRNLAGIIEHTHYHLGQIALIKKMIMTG